MTSSPVCVDASVVMRLVLGSDPAFRAVSSLWTAWSQAGRSITAPTLLYYEIANALHRYSVLGHLRADEVDDLLNVALDLDLTLVADASLHRHTLKLARQYRLPATYDAHYLALAETQGGEFWTSDRRLVERVHGALPWVHLLPDTVT